MGKRKKWIIGIVSFAVILVVSLMAVGYLKRQNEENKLMREIQEIARLDGERKYEDWPLRCEGEYQKVESAIRKYDELFYVKLTELQDVDGGEKLDEFLSEENIENDGPKFEKSQRRISEWEERWEKYYQEFSELCSKEGIMELIDPDIDEYYKTLYYKLVTEENGLNVLSMKKMLDFGYQHQKKVFKWLRDFLNFLETNSEKWKFKNGEMQVDDEAFLEEYDEYVYRLFKLREEWGEFNAEG